MDMAGTEEGSDMPPPPVVDVSKQSSDVRNDPVAYCPPEWSSVPRYVELSTVGDPLCVSTDYFGV